MPYQAPRIRQIAQPERIEVLADRRDDLVVRQPDDMRAALQRGARRLEAQGRDAFDLVERVRVVEQQMLPGIAEIADGSGRVDRDRMAGGDAVVIDDLVGVAIAGGVEQEQADARHALQAVDAVAIERDVERVRIALHAAGLATVGWAGAARGVVF